MTALAFDLVLGLGAGLALGGVYFTLLWRSSRKMLPASPRGTRGGAVVFALGSLSSYVLRLGLAFGVLALLAVHGGARALLAGLAGFLVARWLALRHLSATENAAKATGGDG